MYMHMFARVCESQRCFSLLLSLKYITYSFFSVCPLCCLPSLLLSPPPCLPSACPPLLLSVVCSVAAVCLLLCPLPSPRPRGLFRPIFCVCAPEAPRRSSVCPVVCRAACPSLVSYQAQDGVAVGADAPRICPRPFALLSVMCCRVLSCGFLPCVRVCVLLPCVVWW